MELDIKTLSGFGKRMDKISILPNEIICHIVSFTSAKEAARVAVLSKRFLGLYHIIPKLKFHGLIQEGFTDFVDEMLAMPASFRIKKFSLKCKKVNPTHYAYINRCLLDVLKRGVLELKIDFAASKYYSVPSELFTCKTVVELKLGNGFVISFLPRDALLPALKTLFINSIWFKDLYGCAFEKLLTACNVLRELTIHGMNWEFWGWSGNVSSPTLQRLVIDHGEFGQCDFQEITLDTPSLEYLELYDVAPDEYPVVNLEALVEVKLNLILTVNHMFAAFIGPYDPISSNPTNLIKALKNVQIMTLSSPYGFPAFYYFHEAFPVFEKLHQLTITTHEEYHFCCKFLPFLLRKAPNLETLIIDGPLPYHEEVPEFVCKCMLGYLFLFSCPIKVLEITMYCGTIGDAEQLKHFLWKLPQLKTVKLHCEGDDDNFIIPKGPSTCEIKATFS